MNKAKITIGVGNHRRSVKGGKRDWEQVLERVPDSSFEPPYPRELLALPPKDLSSVKELVARLKARLGWLF